MFFACGLVLMIFILPALAISWVIPAEELSLTAGVMQAFDAFFAYFGLQKLVPIVAIALVCASAGGMLTWLAGPSKGLLLIARREGYLPPFFQQQNENEIPVNILVVQGGVTTVIALLYALVPSVSSAYWILSVMTTQIYLIVYLLMFVAAVKLRRNQPDVERGYTAPALTFMCVVGFLASAAAIVIGFVPPSQFESGSAVAYAALILAGTALLGLLPAMAVPEVPQARLEDDRLGGDVMSTPAPPPPQRVAVDRRPCAGCYLAVVGAVVVVLCVIGLITYSGKKETEQAQQKAQQLTQQFEQAGLPVPADQDIIVRSLGNDGGSVCENPANALGRAILYDQLTNGADFVGRRPVIVDRRIVEGEALILETYCPDKLRGVPGQDRRPQVRRHDRGVKGATCRLTNCARPSRASWAARRDDLAELVAFKSVADPKQYPPEECENAAQWVVDAFAEVGLQDVTASPTPDGSKAVHGHAPGPDGHADSAPVLPLRRAAAARRGRLDLPDLGADRARRALVRPRLGRLQGQHRHAPHCAAGAQAGRAAASRAASS